MGHDSQNLLGNADCGDYPAAIISPVNTNLERTRRDIEKHPNVDFVFDPQMYYPRAERGQLPTWEYFPADADTGDVTDTAWWKATSGKILDVCADLEVPTVCAPTQMPRTYPDSFYQSALDVASHVKDDASGEIEVLPTIIAQMADLSDQDRALRLSSLISGYDFDGVYLFFTSDVIPRREYRVVDDIIGARLLISSLEEAGIRCLVGYCGPEMPLWRTAGASQCATGKYFNLRRFSANRFDDSTADGRNVPYYYEESLLSFLRGPDVVRARRLGLISAESANSPVAGKILKKIDANEAWMADGWRHYLWWFQDAFQRLGTAPELTTALQTAIDNWRRFQASGEAMDEPANDGSWLAPWLASVKTT